MGDTFLLVLVLLVGLVAMIAVISVAARRNRDTISEEHAERVGLRGEAGMRRAQQRHEEHG